MRLSKRTKTWGFSALFFLGFPLVVIVRGMISGVWMDPRWAVGIWFWWIFCWFASLVFFRYRHSSTPAITSAPKRRWSFSLRTLLIAVTLCAWIASQAVVINQRRTTQQWIRDNNGVAFPSGVGVHAPSIPIWRKWFGDRAIESIHLPQGTSNADVQRTAKVFPEARVDILP